MDEGRDVYFIVLSST